MIFEIYRSKDPSFRFRGLDTIFNTPRSNLKSSLTCRFATHAPDACGNTLANGTLCKFVVHEDLFGMILRFSPNQGIWHDLPVLIDRRRGRLFSYHLGKVSVKYSLEAFLARRTLNARSGRTGKHIRMANGLTQRSRCLIKIARYPMISLISLDFLLNQWIY